MIINVREERIQNEKLLSRLQQNILDWIHSLRPFSPSGKFVNYKPLPAPV